MPRFLDLVNDPVFRDFCKECNVVSSVEDTYKPREMAATPPDVEASLTAGPHIYRYPSGYVAVPGNLVAIVVDGGVRYSRYPPDIDFSEFGDRPELEMLYGPARFRVTVPQLLLFHAYTTYFVYLYLSVANTIDLAPLGEMVFIGTDGRALRVTTFTPTSQVVSPDHFDAALSYTGAARLYEEAMYGETDLNLTRAVNLATALALARYKVSGITRMFCPENVRGLLDKAYSGEWLREEIELRVAEAPLDIACASKLADKGVKEIRAEVIGAAVVIRRGDGTCPLRGSLEAGWHYVAPLTSLC